MRLGRVNDAVRDLESNLKTEDIAPEQKSEALVTRGNIFADLGRWGDAKLSADPARGRSHDLAVSRDGGAVAVLWVLPEFVFPGLAR